MKAFKTYLKGTAGALVLAMLAALPAGAEGTEFLGPANIALAPGSGFAIGGVGLFEEDNGSYVNLDGEITVNVPPDATVAQVLLYWNSEHYPQSGPDDTVSVDGFPVTGTSIGGPTNFFSQVWFESFRADITGLGLIGPGSNTVEITNLDSSFRNTGAGILVIYDDGSDGQIQLVDGLDLAYFRLADPLDFTVPQTFAIDPANVDRTAQIPMFVGSVGIDRPNVTEVTAGGMTQTFFNLFTSLDGPQWDSVLLDVQIPAGADEVTVEIISASDGQSDDTPASLAWIAAGLSINPVEPDCRTCKGGVTDLSLTYTGLVPDVEVQVVQLFNANPVLFDGTVQPGETFSFMGHNSNGTMGPVVFVLINGHFNGFLITNCKAPIGPGLVTGAFTVASGESRKGGPLCPIETDNLCVDGPPSSITMEYTGASCDTMDHQQGWWKTVCLEENPGEEQIYVVATDTSDPFNDPNFKIYALEQIGIGDTFTIDAANVGETQLPGTMYLFLMDLRCHIFQVVAFDSSCCAPIRLGDTFGPVTVTDYVPAL
jgi:hypothetical protein